MCNRARVADWLTAKLRNDRFNPSELHPKPQAQPAIFNSDRGSQFTSTAFTAVLLRETIAISIDGQGCWRDNVLVGSFFQRDLAGGPAPWARHDRDDTPDRMAKAAADRRGDQRTEFHGRDIICRSTPVGAGSFAIFSDTKVRSCGINRGVSAQSALVSRRQRPPA